MSTSSLVLILHKKLPTVILLFTISLHFWKQICNTSIILLFLVSRIIMSVIYWDPVVTAVRVILVLFSLPLNLTLNILHEKISNIKSVVTVCYMQFTWKFYYIDLQVNNKLLWKCENVKIHTDIQWGVKIQINFFLSMVFLLTRCSMCVCVCKLHFVEFCVNSYNLRAKKSQNK